MIFKILLILFGAFALSRTYKQYKNQRVSITWLLGWVLLWAAVIAVALSPQTTDVVAAYVGVERGADLIVYVAVVLLSYILYRTIVRQEEMSRELTALVRRLAILEAKKGEAKKERYEA